MVVGVVVVFAPYKQHELSQEEIKSLRGQVEDMKGRLSEEKLKRTSMEVALGWFQNIGR